MDDTTQEAPVQVVTWLPAAVRQRIKIASAVLGITMQQFDEEAIMAKLAQVEASIHDLPRPAS